MNLYKRTLFFLLIPLISFAVSGPPSKVIEASARFEKNQIEAFQILGLQVDIEVIKDHYLYADKLEIIWPEHFMAKNTKLEFSKTEQIFDKFAKKDKIILKEKFQVLTQVEIPAKLPDREEVALGVRYQACSEQYCLLPKTIYIPLSIHISSQNKNTIDSSTREDSLSFERALEKGALFAFFFVFLAGILTSFTPCVFPMIPITLAVIGSRAAHISKLQAFSISLSYVFGIAFTYSILGVFAAKTGALFGALLSSPIVVGIISGMLITMALSMFGLFEIQTPQFISQSLMTKKTGQGHFGAFVAGLFAGVVASPCVGPVLVGILAYVAKSQDVFLGFGLLFVFAMGLGVLFLVLGTFSSLIHYLPKSGPWMNLTKFIFGLSMLALALYFALPVLPTTWIAAIFGFATCLIGYILGFQIKEDKKHNRYRRIIGSIAILSGFVLLSFSAKDHFSKNTNEELSSPKAHLENWQAISKEALSNSLKNQRAVLIDFKADWCASCKELEEKTFSTEEFKELTKDMDLYYLDATKLSPEINQWIEEYKVIGLPTVHFIDKNGQLREDLALTGFENIKDFSKRLEKIKE